MPSAFIDDGYSETETIPAVNGIHGPHVITFRPITSGEIARYESRMRVAGEDELKQRDATSELLASKLIEWDIMDSTGTPVKIEPKNLLNLRPLFFWKLFELCARGLAIPKEPDKKESDLKNSPPG